MDGLDGMDGMDGCWDTDAAASVPCICEYEYLSICMSVVSVVRSMHSDVDGQTNIYLLFVGFVICHGGRG